VVSSLVKQRLNPDIGDLEDGDFGLVSEAAIMAAYMQHHVDWRVRGTV
jgi:hypothetical protein